MIRLSVLMVIFLSPGAFAHHGTHGVPGFACSEGYLYDGYSFGQAVGLGFRTQAPAGFQDSAVECFQLGYESGLALASRFAGESTGCRDTFERAARAAFDGENPGAGSYADCHGAGLHYGQGLLAHGARTGREDKVGTRCLGAYARGMDDWNQRRPQVEDLSEDLRTRFCYRTGYADGALGVGR